MLSLMESDALPQGTLTLLFTDIEGSTALLTSLGTARYADVLSAQRRVMREAITAFGGHEIGTEGDSHFVVFPSAVDAVSAAVQAQRGLVGDQFLGNTGLRVRMGLHTGEPDHHENNYVGMPVHRAARVAAAAHGCQVLLTDATWILVSQALPSGVGAEDVGEHRLKDLPAPEHLRRLVIEGVPVVDAPPKALGTPVRLPQPNTTLVSRDAELAMMDDFLARNHRLITLLGPGGVGKTRLAVETAIRAAERFPGGVHFVDLSTVSESALAWPQLNEVLPTDPVTAEIDGPLPAVAKYVENRRCLLILDNLEQLRDADALVAELLEMAESSVVLVTSRQPVRLVGEQELPVQPLSSPSTSDADPRQLESSPAVRLFLQHARRVRPGWRPSSSELTHVAEICRALDGLPLALELAAVRLRMLSPQRLLSGLHGGLSLVARERDRPARQRSLRDTIQWSYDLLDSVAQRVLRLVAVAPGGADLGTVEALTDSRITNSSDTADPLDTLAELVDASLVRLVEGSDGEPRVRLLHMVRQFACDALSAAEEADRALTVLAERMADIAEEMGSQVQGARQLWALDRLQEEKENMRAALSWSLTPEGPPPPRERIAFGLRIAVALGSFWQHHGHASEGRRWLERAISLSDQEEYVDDIVRRTAALEALQSLAGILYRQGDVVTARQALDRTVTAWRELNRDDLLIAGLSGLGLCLRVLDDLDGARVALEESVEVARRVGDPTRLAGALTDLGILETDEGSPERAAELFREAIAVEEPTGDVWGPAVSRANLAVALLESRQPEEAFDVLAQVVPVLPQLGDVELMIVVLEGLAAVLVQLGDDVRAARTQGAAEQLREVAGLPLPDRDRREVEAGIAPGRKRLGDIAWAAAMSQGAALAPEAVLQEAVARQPVRPNSPS